MSSQFARMEVWAVLGYSTAKNQLYIIISVKMFAFEFGNGRDLEIFNTTIIKISGCTLAVKRSKLKK